MANTQSMQFFLKTAKAEQVVLEMLGSVIGFPVESTDFEVRDAIGFAQITQYAEGFEEGILVTWPANLENRVKIDEVARKVAVGLQVQVLLEAGDEIWLLVNPDGILRHTEVIYLDEGIDVGVLGQVAQG